MVLELGLLGAIVETPLGQALFGTASLPAATWLVPLPFALAMFGLAELLKAAGRRRSLRRAGQACIQGSSPSPSSGRGP